jgi:hypothetical protein
VLHAFFRTPHCRTFAAAGRWDLHEAITRAGGYKEVGRLLNRRPSWPVSKHNAAAAAAPKDLAELGEAIAAAEAAAEGGWGAGVMPSVQQLKEAGRQDLVEVRELVLFLMLGVVKVTCWPLQAGAAHLSMRIGCLTRE